MGKLVYRVNGCMRSAALYETAFEIGEAYCILRHSKSLHICIRETLHQLNHLAEDYCPVKS